MLPPIDLIVCGAVAVNARGARVGKGGGFSDLEYGLLAEAGRVGPRDAHRHDGPPGADPAGGHRDAAPRHRGRRGRDPRRDDDASARRSRGPAACTARRCARRRSPRFRSSSGCSAGGRDGVDATVGLVHALLPVTAHVTARVAAAHPSARILGTERMGSAVVVDSGGLLLTVNYVVMGARRVRVTMTDGRRLDAKVAAQDFESGLALLRVPATGLPAARLASSDEVALGASVFVIAATGPTERRVAGGHRHRSGRVRGVLGVHAGPGHRLERRESGVRRRAPVRPPRRRGRRGVPQPRGDRARVAGDSRGVLHAAPVRAPPLRARHEPAAPRVDRRVPPRPRGAAHRRGAGARRSGRARRAARTAT